MKIRIYTLPLLVVFAASAHAGTVMGNGGATEITQLLNNTELITQTTQQIQLVEQGIQKVNQMIQDAKRFAQDPLDLQQFVGMYDQIASEVQQAQALAYGTVNAVSNFQALHPTFDLSKPYDPSAFVARNNTTMQTIQSVINANASAVASAGSDQARNVALANMINSADGQEKALDAGNAVQYQVLQQLRDTQMYNQTVAQAQASYMSDQVSLQNSKQQVLDQQYNALEKHYSY